MLLHLVSFQLYLILYSSNSHPPRAWSRLVSINNRLVPDGHLRVEDVERVAAAIRLRVGAGKYSSKHNELSPEQCAAVIGQRRNFTLCLRKQELEILVLFLV